VGKEDQNTRTGMKGGSGGIMERVMMEGQEGVKIGEKDGRAEAR